MAMRQFIFASHAHFAQGIAESIEMLAGGRENVRALSLYVDGNNDLPGAIREALSRISTEDEVIVCTDLMGGSVNNEFTLVAQSRPGTHLVTNMNLPLLIQLLFAEEGRDTAEVIREICAADDARVKYVNDLLDASVKEAPGFGDDF